MANALGFDLGAVARNAESVKTMRINRERQQLALDEDLKAAGKADDLEGQRRRAVGGDASAITDMVVTSPDQAGKFMEVFGGLDDAGKKAKQREVEVLGRAAAFVLQSEDPATAYATVLSQLPEEVRNQFPPQYDETFVKSQLALATETDMMIGNYYAGQKDTTKRREDEAADIRKTERDTQAKITVATATAAVKKGASGGKRQPKAADSSVFQKGALRYFDGILGPTGDVRLTDPQDAAKAQQLMTRTSTIWSRTDLTHDEAMAKAAEELGYGLNSDANAAADDDPLGLRGGG